MSSWEIKQGDVLDVLRGMASESVQCVVTSPPYFGLRDYGAEGQIGLEKTPAEYVAALVEVFREVRRVLRKDGTCWLNLGSSYTSGPNESGGRSALPKNVDTLRGSAYDSDGKAPLSSQALDYACRGLCDEHLSALSHHIQHSSPPQQLSLLHGERTSHDNGHSDSLLEVSAGEPLDVLASTMPQSWRQSQAECLRCESRAASYRSLLPTYGGGAQASARKGLYNHDIIPPASVVHTGGMGALDLAYQYYTTVSRLPAKNLLMIPAMVVMALQSAGWILRSEITWCKRAPMPESVKDRPTSATEKIYLLTKSERYYYDADAVREPQSEEWLQRTANRTVPRPPPRGGDVFGKAEHTSEIYSSHPSGRNMWNYWLLSPENFSEAHFATFPTEIPRRAILAGTSERGCCPECGAGWRRVVERSAGMDRNRDVAEGLPEMMNGHGIRQLSGSAHKAWKAAHPDISHGWQPSCACPPHTPIPCTVLDIFAGSGTTLMVALRLGRRAIGIELKPEYVEMATRRIRDDCPMFNSPIEASA